MNRRDFCVTLPGLFMAAASACTRRGPVVEQSVVSNANPEPSIPEPLQRSDVVPVPDRTDVVPLFRAYPRLGREIPYVRLGLFPTPVEKLSSLGPKLGIGELYVKRDDLSGLTYGGGKVRKLEFFLADAKRQGKKTVLTSGAVGSNHALATTIYAAELGLKTILLLLPQPPSRHVRANLLADVYFGAELRSVRNPPTGRLVRGRTGPREDAEAYVIPAGGSSPLGNAGFVNAAFELRSQIESGILPEPDVLYVALGTMGSAAGLILGLKAAGLHTRVIPVRASTLATANPEQLVRMFDDTNDFLRSLDPAFPKLPLKRSETAIVHGHVGGGYAVPTRKGTHAAKVFEEHTGVALETTYTGKAFGALMEDAPALSNKVVLFWNTYNSRQIDLTGAKAGDVPQPFRAYFEMAGG